MLENVMMGFQTSFSLYNIIYCFTGCLLGTIIGVLPGLGPTATIAMLLFLTYKLPVESAIIMLAGIYYGSQYGGTITSVLLRIPGEAASVVTAIDGYAMAQKGKAGKALGIAAFGSFIAGTLGTIGLSVLSPFLAGIALAFGPPEYTALMLLGLTLVIYLGSHSYLKALAMGALGLALGTVGMDPATAMERFTFGSQSLTEGINMAILAMGIFGVGEIFFMAENTQARKSADKLFYRGKLKELLPDRKDWKASIKPIFRGSILGFLLGIIPGGGATIASFSSYAIEKGLSSTPENFGQGAIEGVAGPESANNSAVSGAFIPLLTLGIPANSVMALMIGAFMIHGVTPGPLIMKDHPELFWGVITSMYIGNILLLIMNVPLIRLFVKIVEIPYAILSPLIILICTIGAYSINNSHADVIMMILFGILGYLMRKFDYDLAPLILAFVLGPLLEKSMRQSLISSNGDLMIFFTRPIAATIMMITVVVIISSCLFATVLKQKQAARVLDKLRSATSDDEP